MLVISRKLQLSLKQRNYKKETKNPNNNNNNNNKSKQKMVTSNKELCVIVGFELEKFRLEEAGVSREETVFWEKWNN